MSIRSRFPRPEITDDRGWLPSWLSWRPTNSFLLAHAETRLLSRVRGHIESFFVPIFESTARIRTMIITRKGISPFDPNQSYNQQCPIVLVHGMGAGVAMWVKNLDSLCKERPVYCFDVLGFGRSSRPYDMPPSTDRKSRECWLPHYPVEQEERIDPRELAAHLAEEQFIRSIEEWREQMRLPRFILLGHSLGGYLAFGYALRYPHRVSHLILADPWGFPEYHGSNAANFQRRYNWIFRFLTTILTPFNPLFILRGSGPFGPMLIRKFRQDLGLTFNSQATVNNTPTHIAHETMNSSSGPTHLLTEALEAVEETAPAEDEQAGGMAMPPTPHHMEEVYGINGESNDTIDQGCIFDYIYHCNAQYPASGEAAFKCLNETIGWAIRPMLRRVHELSPHVPVTFIYGGRSWMDPQSGISVKYLRGVDAYTNVEILEGAGHHVYAQAHEEFNNLCCEISNQVKGYSDEEMIELCGTGDDVDAEEEAAQSGNGC